MKEIIKKILVLGLLFLMWAIFALTVMFSVILFSALITYLHWEYLLTGLHGIIASLAVIFGSFGFALLISFIFIDKVERVTKVLNLINR